MDPSAARTSRGWKLPGEAQALEGTGENGGYSPLDLQSAYNLTPGVLSSGGSQTIALIDAYGYQRAEEDLIRYRQRYELSPCTTADGCFKKVNERGEAANYPGESEDWQLEQALDVDMASAACPSCHILLVEANSSSPSDLGAAVDEAAALGATEISSSYGSPEENHSEEEEAARDYDHPGVLITAAAGDDGYDDRLQGADSPSFPASLPAVVAVGGTSLHRAANSRGWSEEVWSESGSGCSRFAKPAWQLDTGCAGRTINDVAAVAACETPVSVAMEGRWANICGTSVAAPLVAGIEAHTSTFVRSLPGADAFYSDPGAFFAVTTGSDGECEPEYLCTARVGYSGPTGNGTPDGPITTTTVRATATTQSATAIADTEATLNGTVDPQGHQTSYHFEYRTGATYNNKVPTPYPSAGSGSAGEKVSVALTGLQPNTTYHYRLTAVSLNEIIAGGESVFRTARPGVAAVSPGTGPANGGNTVTISGTNFAGVTAVKFGSLRARSFVVNSESSISAVAPAGVGTVEVTVTTPAGSSPTTSLDRYAYQALRWAVLTPSSEAGLEYGWLNGVSCASGSGCMAVGHYWHPAGSVNNRALVYKFSGGRWVQETVTAAEGYSAPYLSSVSCASSSACTAVGYALPEGSSGTVPFVARWNGSAWSAQEITPPKGTEESELLGISCPSEAECVAVGDRKNSAGVRVNYAALWRHNTWSSLATPSAEESTHSIMTGVSCGSDASCMAVGWYDAVGGAKPFSAILANGLSGGWTLQLRERFGTIEGVTCTSSAFCVAVGGEYGPPTAEAWNGSRWTLATTPELADVTGGDLKAVSCVSATDCTAVGLGYAPQLNKVTLATRWNGESWTEEPTAQAGEKPSELTGVSCVALSGCSAVGATKANGKPASLIDIRGETTPNAPALEPGVASSIGAASATLNANVGAKTHEQGTAAKHEAEAAATGSISLDGSTFEVQSNHDALIKLTCTGTATCSGQLTLTIRTTTGKGKKKHAKTETMGSTACSIQRGKTATINVALAGLRRGMLKAARGHLNTALTIVKTSPKPIETQTLRVRLSQAPAPPWART